MKKFIQKTILGSVAAIAPISLFAEDLSLSDNRPVDLGDDPTGTDPRGFGNKFMPYYRYTKLRNDIEVNELTLFGMYNVDGDSALTYEFPIVKNVDFGDLNGIPGDADTSEQGIGDLNLRYFTKPDGWQGTYDDEGNGWQVMPVIETTLPTANDDILGGNAWIVSPGFALVVDIPGPPPLGLGFFAMMNFFDYSALRDKDDTDETVRYRGRWFWMQPLSKPGPDLMDGLYCLTEFQPVYDFRESDFDFWVGPEFGKIIKDGQIAYLKPGWELNGEDPDDRSFSFEIGYRYFF